MKDINHSKLTTLLKTLRVDAGYTQKEVSDKLTKPQSYVSKYESGEKTLDYFEIREICMAIKVPFINFVEELEKNIKK